jgi:hypothetical protein
MVLSILLGEKKTIRGALYVRHGFDPESDYVGFVVDKVALGQVFIQVPGASLLFYWASIFIHS